MLNLLSLYSRSRITWALLLFCMLGLEATALVFQHYFLLPPCSLCIYQRITLLGIIFACMIALINPQNFFLRLTALLIWLGCSAKGFFLAYEQARLQFEPKITDSCALNINFPSFLPLDSLLPSVFKPEGSCGEKLWSFLTLEMSQWMLIIFIALTLVCVVVIVSQLFSPNIQKQIKNLKFD